MLNNIYPCATGRESAYVTNGDLNEILEVEQFTSTRTEIEKGIDVITALSQAGSINQGNILNYAYRPIGTNAYVFDIYSSTVPSDEACANFISVVNNLGNRFIVMDLNGDVYSESVKTITDISDVILYIFEPTMKAVKEARAYLDSIDADERLKVKLVCSKWDTMGVSKRTIQEAIKIRSNSILWFPYSRNIQRTMFERRLGILNRLLINGQDNCLDLRQPLYDILSYLCNSGNVKVVKEVSKWVL